MRGASWAWTLRQSLLACSAKERCGRSVLGVAPSAEPLGGASLALALERWRRCALVTEHPPWRVGGGASSRWRWSVGDGASSPESRQRSILGNGGVRSWRSHCWWRLIDGCSSAEAPWWSHRGGVVTGDGGCADEVPCPGSREHPRPRLWEDHDSMQWFHFPSFPRIPSHDPLGMGNFP